MYNVNILIFFSVTLLVSLFCRIKGDFTVIKEQREIASRPQLENNLDRTQGESVITTASTCNGTVDDEKFDDNELRKLFVQKFKFYENLERERITMAHGRVRKTRDVANNTSKHGIECVSCFANGTSLTDKNCYRGTSPKIKCSDAEQCFVELNPQYLRRGCTITARVNRTFYCRCPLCNDKPSNVNTYYDYESVEDWVYDNLLLARPLFGTDLLCKVCETTGTNPVADKNCRKGSSADYMICEADQICYINIDDEVDHVSRGCMSIPVFTSMYFFCNQTGCNDHEHTNPRLTFRALPLSNEKVKKKLGLFVAQTAQNYAEKIKTYRLNICLACILFFSYLFSDEKVLY
ncbi:hypothetical protein ABMA28_002809 [Loxostege sticticalis]|uniref:Uncharacterized protein n=1 Tax=Loxostege sticticalis TaxID=481309 RepID=A0ABD0T0Q6_LOXSC